MFLAYDEYSLSLHEYNIEWHQRILDAVTEENIDELYCCLLVMHEDGTHYWELFNDGGHNVYGDTLAKLIVPESISKEHANCIANEVNRIISDGRKMT